MKPAIFWFRRDLRLHDNHGLYKALKENAELIPVFIFDKTILDLLTDKKDKRVSFIHQSLQKLDAEIRSLGASGLHVLHGTVEDCWHSILNDYKPSAVYANHDYEPQAIKRDLAVEHLCGENGVDFKTFKDQVVFEESEIVKADGDPYTVYTPYSKAWKAKLTDEDLSEFPSLEWTKNFSKRSKNILPSLAEIGFHESEIVESGNQINENHLKSYDKKRDFPALDATSHQSVHLRFGTVSVRQLTKKFMKINSTLLNELIWREFFMMILYHFPHSVNKEFKSKYSAVQWRYDEEDFKKWCFGQTGYPIVDAGMRELNATGFMHNRVRMITASFLVKHLLIDWRWGERYFAKKLLDFDLSANVGNWQWAAGTGCDAAPYFRIFNPYTQTDKFDKDREYIRKWVPEFESPEYPKPMVDHKEARERALKVYKEGLA